MNAEQVLSQRLHTQRLAGTPFARPENVVQSLLAVQSQDFAGASWSVGQRVANGTDAGVRQAFNEGQILRTHILRPTWHFVTPADIRWLLRITAPRVHALNAYQYRQLELDESTFTRAHHLFSEALAGGNQLTRAELGALLSQDGISPAGQRLAYIVMHAELEALICSGALRGKQHTYALLDERAPQAGPLDGDEALAELTRRYFTGHGPTTERDLAWWASLTRGQVRRGLDIVRAELESFELDSQVFWHGPAPPPPPMPPDAYLIPEYDEVLLHSLAFPDMPWTRDPTTWDDTFYRPIVIAGKRAGTWRRKIGPKSAIFEAQLFATLAPDELATLAAVVERYSAFLNLPVELTHV